MGFRPVIDIRQADTSRRSNGREDALMNPLMTDDERAQLLANGEARTAASDFDPMPVVRLFTPDAHAIWLLAALDPVDGARPGASATLVSACPNWAPCDCRPWRPSSARGIGRFCAIGISAQHSRCWNTHAWRDSTARFPTDQRECRSANRGQRLRIVSFSVLRQTGSASIAIDAP